MASPNSIWKIFIMSKFLPHQNKFDWSRYLNSPSETHKEYLLEECCRNNISIHIDSPAEITHGIYSIFRPIASEAELERRLIAKLAIDKSVWANRIFSLSFLVSLISLVVSIWRK